MPNGTRLRCFAGVNRHIIDLLERGATDQCLRQQLRNFAREGDIVLAISGSGNSPNVVRAVQWANSAGCRTIALTGRDGGKLGPLVHLNIRTPSPHMGRIEDSHMIVCHMIAYCFMEG